MEQINNEFAPCYYLTREAEVYNRETGRFIKADNSESFRLKTTDNKIKKVSKKKLYKLVFNENYCQDNIQDLPGEEWKFIDRTDNRYMCSSKGRVKSLVGIQAIILKPQYVNGYERVEIVIDGERKCYLVSRLVAAAFLPFPQSLDMQLHHKNGERSCNDKDNLEWLTPKQHQEAHKRMKKEKAENGSKL